MGWFKGCLFGGVVFFIFLEGCASKNYQTQAPQILTESQVQKLDFEKKDFENPPLVPEELDAQEREEVPRFDITLTRNNKVEQWLEYFQGRGSQWYQIWLQRSGRYIPLMRKILIDHDLPEDLVYLAMIESGFSPKAYSRARAVGPWQFIKSTGKLYGLQINFWMDERRDPEKSTLAAARHLKDLYDQFQSWKLAAAAYNAGANKVSRAIRRYKTEDFWELTKGRYLKAETRHYVPKLIAAALIAKEPEKYGFHNIEYEAPLEYEKIVLKRPVNLIKLSAKAEFDLQEILVLNPELNHSVTPPDVEKYELRVPSGSSEKFLVAYHSLSEEERYQMIAHRVRRGETLSHIARAYRVPYAEIMRLNGLLSARKLRIGQELVIPLPAGVRLKEKKKPSQETIFFRPKKSGKKLAKSHGLESHGLKVHVVKRGETLTKIADFYGLTVQKIKNKNKIRRNKIYVGERLRLPRG